MNQAWLGYIQVLSHNDLTVTLCLGSGFKKHFIFCGSKRDKATRLRRVTPTLCKAILGILHNIGTKNGGNRKTYVWNIKVYSKTNLPLYGLRVERRSQSFTSIWKSSKNNIKTKIALNMAAPHQDLTFPINATNSLYVS